MKLEEMRPEQCRAAKKEGWPLFLPIGTIEYHGEHLPLGVDGFAVLKALERVESKIDCVVAPMIWYGPSSYAVAGPEQGTIDVDIDAFEAEVFHVLKGLIDNGYRRLFIVIHHQFEEGSFMPAALACKKAGLKIVFRLLERDRGQGWWGSPNMERYYEQMGSSDDPFSWIRVLPLMSPEIQHEMGYDHAGKLETSLMLATNAEQVDVQCLENDGLWFTKTAREASREHGEKAYSKIVDYLIETTRA